MSDGNEFQRSDAATGNVRRPTVVSQNGGTSSWCDNADRNRRRLSKLLLRCLALFRPLLFLFLLFVYFVYDSNNKQKNSIGSQQINQLQQRDLSAICDVIQDC